MKSGRTPAPRGLWWTFHHVMSACVLALILNGYELVSQDAEKLALIRRVEEQRKQYADAYLEYKNAAERGEHQFLIEALRQPDTQMKVSVLAAARSLPFEGKVQIAKAALADELWNQPIATLSPESISQGAYREQTSELLKETLGREVTPNLFDENMRAKLAAELEWRSSARASPVWWWVAAVAAIALAFAWKFRRKSPQ